MANIYTFNPFTTTLDNTFSGTAVAVWGTVIGTLSNQTDLQNSIGALQVSMSAVAPLQFNATGRTVSIVNVGNAADGYLTSTQFIALGGGQSHNALAGLDYATAGHTGFQPTLTAATITSDGYLTSTNWIEFDAKQATIAVTAPITLTGTSVGITNVGAAANGYLTSSQFINLITGSTGALSTSTAAIHIAGGSTSIIGTGVSIDLASSHLGSSTAGVYIAGGSNSILGVGVSFDIATVSVTQAGLLTSSQYIYLSSGNGLSGVAPIIVGGGSTGITNVTATTNGYLTSTQYLNLSGGSGGGFTRVEMSSAQIVAGIYPVTHSKAIAAPYSVMVSVFDAAGKQILPDNVHASTNNLYVDMTSYGAIQGTYGVMYFA